MIAHVFLLTLIVGDKTVSNDMYFWNINDCNYYASRLTRRYGNYKYNHQVPQESKATAYCTPKLVDTSKIRPQVY